MRPFKYTSAKTAATAIQSVVLNQHARFLAGRYQPRGPDERRCGAP
jgi:hypothetical protein